MDNVDERGVVTGILPSDEEIEGKTAAVRVTRSVAQRVQKIVSEEASVERRVSPRLQNRPEDKKPYYGSHRKYSIESVEDKVPTEKSEVNKKRKGDFKNVGEENVKEERFKNSPLILRSNEPKRSASVEVVEERRLTSGTDSAKAVGKSAYTRVKDTLRVFNSHYLHFIQEEEKRCKKVEDNDSQNVKASKVKKGDASVEDGKRHSKRPDLKAISKMMETKTTLNHKNRFGHIPGIDVGHQFFSRAEMVVIGFHNHWLNGIDYMGESHSKPAEYKTYTFPLAISIVMSGQYEDDLDNSEDVVYTGQGGNNLVGNRRQIKDQVMLRGNLALKNNMEQSVPVRVTRGHESSNSYCGRVYTYDGLYKVVQYWAEKGLSGFTVFKYRLKRLKGQPMLTTNQVHFTRANATKSLAELRGLVCKDISGGQEEKPIPATNLFDDPPVPPTGFTYLKSVKLTKSVKLPKSVMGCSCKGTCNDPRTCACARLNGSDFPYVRRDGGRLIEAKAVVFECGPNCGCGPSCVNRISQRGIKYRLEVFRTPKKGWAVRSWDSIPSGAPVCEYTGTLRRTDELDNVSENDFIFEIDCLQTMKGLDGRERRFRDVSLPASADEDKRSDCAPEFCIDAGSSGGVARFINHSCEPNLFVQCVLSSHHDVRLARVMLFASDNIPPLQELSYDYGYALDSVIGPDGRIKKVPCYCGADTCRKRLY